MLNATSTSTSIPSQQDDLDALLHIGGSINGIPSILNVNSSEDDFIPLDEQSHYFSSEKEDVVLFKPLLNDQEKEQAFKLFENVYYYLFKDQKEQNWKYLFTELLNNEIRFIIEEDIKPIKKEENEDDNKENVDENEQKEETKEEQENQNENNKEVNNEKKESVLIESNFIIRIPKLEKIIHVHKEVLEKESKVFSGMLNSEMMESKNNEMIIEEDEELFLKMIEFIYIGKIGKTKEELNNEIEQQKNEQLIDIFGLIDLLIIADQYQCISLLKQIGKVAYENNAIVIAKKCCELSEDTQNIILPNCAQVIADTFDCIVVASIFKLMVKSTYLKNLQQQQQLNEAQQQQDENELQQQSVLVVKEEEEEDDEEDKEMKEKFQRVKHYLTTKYLDRGIGSFNEEGMTNENDIINQLILMPSNLLKFILKVDSRNQTDNNKLVSAFLWLIADIDNSERRKDFREIISECIDLTEVDYDSLYKYLYLVSTEYEEEFTSLKDKLLKVLFKKCGAQMLEEEITEDGKTIIVAKSKVREQRMLLLGLDASGKTTLLYKLKLGEVVTTIPTIGFNVETFTYKKHDFTAWDVGGGDKIRLLWRHYYANTSVVCFVIDSNDYYRLNEIVEEIERVSKDQELDKIPFLIYANKQDLPNAMPPRMIYDKVKGFLSNRHFFIQPCCSTTGEGLYEGLEWIVRVLDKANKKK